MPLTTFAGPVEHEQDVPKSDVVSETEVAETQLVKVGDVQFSTKTGRLDIKGRIPQLDDVSVENGFNIFLERYRSLILGILGTATMTAIVFFIVHFIELGATSGNPQKREKAISGVLWTGIATAGLGGATMFVGFFVNAL